MILSCKSGTEGAQCGGVLLPGVHGVDEAEPAPVHDLTFVVRPIAVGACAVWFRLPWREQLFLSWAGLRGAVPIILATVPLAARTDNADALFDVVLVFVIVYTALQAPSLPWVARSLGLVDTDAGTAVQIEPAPMDEQRADLFKITLTEESRLTGVPLRSLELPADTVIALVMRGRTCFPALEATVLHRGDQLLVVAPCEQESAVQRYFTDVGSTEPAPQPIP